jgi:hypothetical protein
MTQYVFWGFPAGSALEGSDREETPYPGRKGYSRRIASLMPSENFSNNHLLSIFVNSTFNIIQNARKHSFPICRRFC